jgi:hypothetical protein
MAVNQGKKYRRKCSAQTTALVERITHVDISDLSQRCEKFIAGGGIFEVRGGQALACPVRKYPNNFELVLRSTNLFDLAVRYGNHRAYPIVFRHHERVRCQ